MGFGLHLGSLPPLGAIKVGRGGVLDPLMGSGLHLGSPPPPFSAIKVDMGGFGTHRWDLASIWGLPPPSRWDMGGFGTHRWDSASIWGPCPPFWCHQGGTWGGLGPIDGIRPPFGVWDPLMGSGLHLGGLGPIDGIRPPFGGFGPHRWDSASIWGLCPPFSSLSVPGARRGFGCADGGEQRPGGVPYGHLQPGFGTTGRRRGGGVCSPTGPPRNPPGPPCGPPTGTPRCRPPH